MSPAPSPVPAASGPMPPDMHWALVLVFASVSCGLFGLVWLFIEASFMKKIDRASKAILFLILGFVCIPVGYVVFIVGTLAASQSGQVSPLVGLGFLPILAGIVFHILAVFGMRASLVRYYNTVEPINLRLSGIMTFFFALYYFQYHFCRIAEWKKTGHLQPQG
jgi:hypothetical protein